ncbi:MAG: sugar ABC transporter permease [Spirochaetales bacterium]|nr:sugar ABC transporter permease [Spirochaetales bacterium]
MNILSNRKNTTFFTLIFLPALLVILFLTIYPILNTVYLSFFKYNYLSDERSFIGLKNFITIGSDKVFQTAFLNTIIFALIATAFEVGLGIFLALLFYGDFPLKRHSMIIIIFPMMVSTMVICAVWKVLYHYDIGLFNYLFRMFGLKPVGWLINPDKALFSIILVDIWQWTPFAFLVMQAGLSSIPSEIFEASSIDGAGYFKNLFHVTIPILSSQILLVIMLRTIDTFRIFGKVYALTQGGPGNATETVSYYIYREGFSYFNLGRASASAIYVLLVISAIAMFYIKGIMKEEN